jgi:hypothetical protein
VARGEWCGVVRRLPLEEERRRLPRTDSATVTHGVTAACATRGAGVAAWNQQLVVDRQRDGERQWQLSEQRAVERLGRGLKLTRSVL